MKVRCLTNGTVRKHNLIKFKWGDVLDVSPDVAQDLVEKHYGFEYAEKKEDKKGGD